MKVTYGRSDYPNMMSLSSILFSFTDSPQSRFSSIQMHPYYLQLSSQGAQTLSGIRTRRFGQGITVLLASSAFPYGERSQWSIWLILQPQLSSFPRVGYQDTHFLCCSHCYHATFSCLSILESQKQDCPKIKQENDGIRGDDAVRTKPR
jgi:hypothetical protein